MSQRYPDRSKALFVRCKNEIKSIDVGRGEKGTRIEDCTLTAVKAAMRMGLWVIRKTSGDCFFFFLSFPPSPPAIGNRIVYS